MKKKPQPRTTAASLEKGAPKQELLSIEEVMGLPSERRELLLLQNLGLMNNRIVQIERTLTQTNERLADLQALVIKMQGKSS